MRRICAVAVLLVATLVTSTGEVPAGADVPAAPVVDAASTRDGEGYWLVTAEGSVYAYGHAPFLGDLHGVALAQPVVAMAPTVTGRGYWLLASDGGVFTFGDAPFHGSTGGLVLNRPMAAISPTQTGAGYWTVARDGGVFAFGDAAFLGSTGGVTLNQPVGGILSSGTGEGYRLLASDGGVFSFGDAPFFGSDGGDPPADAVVDLAATPSDQGYWTVTSTGVVSVFGDAEQLGGLAGHALEAPVVGIAPNPEAQGYLLVLGNGQAARFGQGVEPANPIPGTGPSTTVPASTTTTAPVPTTSTTTTPSTTAPTPTSTTLPPGLGPGTMLVGSDILPGRYRAEALAGCYWERLRGFNGSLGDVIANDLVGESLTVLVDVAPTDLAFRADGACGPWRPYESQPVVTFGNGSRVVGEEVASGGYTTTADDGCYYARLSSFAGGTDSIVANGFVSGDATPVVVTISPGDVGFESSGPCGTWMPVGSS